MNWNHDVLSAFIFVWLFILAFAANSNANVAFKVFEMNRSSGEIITVRVNNQLINHPNYGKYREPMRKTLVIVTDIERYEKIVNTHERSKFDELNAFLNQYFTKTILIGVHDSIKNSVIADWIANFLTDDNYSIRSIEIMDERNNNAIYISEMHKITPIRMYFNNIVQKIFPDDLKMIKYSQHKKEQIESMNLEMIFHVPFDEEYVSHPIKIDVDNDGNYVRNTDFLMSNCLPAPDIECHLLVMEINDLKSMFNYATPDDEKEERAKYRAGEIAQKAIIIVLGITPFKYTEYMYLVGQIIEAHSGFGKQTNEHVLCRGAGRLNMGFAYDNILIQPMLDEYMAVKVLNDLFPNSIPLELRFKFYAFGHTQLEREYNSIIVNGVYKHLSIDGKLIDGTHSYASIFDEHKKFMLVVLDLPKKASKKDNWAKGWINFVDKHEKIDPDTKILILRVRDLKTNYRRVPEWIKYFLAHKGDKQSIHPSEYVEILDNAGRIYQDGPFTYNVCKNTDAPQSQ